jgi:hypothetical protein
MAKQSRAQLLKNLAKGRATRAKNLAAARRAQPAKKSAAKAAPSKPRRAVRRKPKVKQMATKTSTAKALASPAAQAAIRGKASALLRKKAGELQAKFKGKLRAAASKHGKDLIGMTLDPILTGAGGAFALDMALKPFGDVWPDTAKGDVAKAALSIGLGYVGSKYVRSPYLRHATIGAATINVHRLMTRVANRVQAGNISGIFSDDDAGDLNGWADRRGRGRGDIGLGDTESRRRRIAVDLHLADGRVQRGFADRAGNLFDAGGRFIPVQPTPSPEMALGGVREDRGFPRFSPAAIG